MRRKWLIWAVTFILLAILSYFREVFFVSVNKLMAGESNFYADSMKIPILETLTTSNLLYVKYAATIIFSFLFSSISLLGLRFGLKNKTGFNTGFTIYILVLILLIILGVISLFNGSFETLFPLLRNIMHMVQNPLLFCIISISVISMDSLKINLK